MFVVLRLLSASLFLVGLSHSLVEDKYRPRFRGYDEGQIDAAGEVEEHAEILEESSLVQEDLVRKVRRATKILRRTSN